MDIQIVWESIRGWPWREILDYGKSLAVPGAAVYVAYKFGAIQAEIGHQQASTAKQNMSIANDKLRLELFEKRFVIYSVASNVIHKVVRHGEKISHDDVEALLEATERADWLFDKFTAGFLSDRLFQDTFDLANLLCEIDAQPDAERWKELSSQILGLRKAFEQHRVQLHELMLPYLGFTGRAA